MDDPVEKNLEFDLHKQKGTAMETSEAWRSLFENWPAAIPHQGLIVTKFNETLPFVGFLLSDGLLIIERDKPDSYGGRKVIMAYDAIIAVKMTDPGELARFQVMGFQAPM